MATTTKTPRRTSSKTAPSKSGAEATNTKAAGIKANSTKRASTETTGSTKTAAATTRKTAIAKRAQAMTLVTGGTGFLGAHLVRQLVEAGAKNIRVMNSSGAPAWLAELGVETVNGSITSAQDVARAVEGVGEIYHLAGRVSREPDDAHEMYALHVDGTRLLCDAARAGGVKSIVMASTSGTIAVTEDGEATPDEDWPPPLEIISRWPYYASKVYQERVALEHFAGRGLRLVFVNPGLLLGPGDERLSSTKLVLDFLARKIIATPKGGLSFVDVRDAAQTFRAAMERGRHGERYLVGAVNWSFEKFFARLERLTKIPAPRFSLPSRLAINGARGLHALYRHWHLASPVEPSEIEMAEHFWYLDASKATRELGFTPRDPADTLYDTVVYLRKNFLGNEAFNQ